MAGSYSRRKIEANAGSSQLRVNQEINPQEVPSAGQSRPPAVSMGGSILRGKIKAKAGTSQLRVDAEINHQEVASDGQSASSAVKIGWKTPANPQWARPFADTDAGAARTWRYHALRSHFRV